MKRVTLRELARYDWIMPEPGAPRRQAFEHMFAALPSLPKVGIETTSLSIYRSILATSDRLTLMSRLAAQADESAALTVLRFRSPHLRRSDGVASRVDWHPTEVHRRFLQLLRGEARRLAGGGRSSAQAA
jgi:DNA-binding transcriptional LysR family regulator